MGRPTKSRTLLVYMNGSLVGSWIIPTRGQMEFLYDPAWVSSPRGRPLSLSLPMAAGGVPLKGDPVQFYFDNLLPDSEPIRRRLQTRFHTRTGDAFDLLAAIGRDCVGAVQLLPENESPGNFTAIDVEPLTETQIERILRDTNVPARGRAYQDDGADFRISIAGAQEKTALTWHCGQWCRPLGATPTTHIFKLPLGIVGGRFLDMQSSVENEWLCAEILCELGLNVAKTEICQFGSQRVLVVERFDRALAKEGSHWLRLPQEDFCQATGKPSSLKYERDGGPGIAAISKLLKLGDDPSADIPAFLTAQLMFWMLAATDGHAKNFSIHIQPKGYYRLTPLYDILSAWPVIGTGSGMLAYREISLSMALAGRNRHYALHEIQYRHFLETAKQHGHGTTDMARLIDEIVQRVPQVIEAIGRRLPPNFPGQIFESITRGLTESAAKLTLGRDAPMQCQPPSNRLT